MKYKELKGLTVDELKKKRAEMKEELLQAKMKNTLGQLSNPMNIRLLRRGIARIHTTLTQKLSQ
jgi:large subunit ribosomal protein L29